MATMAARSSVTTARSCGSCTLCCKLISVVELGKPMGQWCPHCIKGKRCGIYETRPNQCRAFNCGWLADPAVGEEWKPTQSKMVFYNVREGDTNKLIFLVDPGSPLAWKNEPYYSQLKQMARNGLNHNGIINVFVGKRVIVILPDKDVDLGICDLNEKFSYRKVWNGLDWEVEVHKERQPAPLE
jgi:hypothetical protein